MKYHARVKDGIVIGKGYAKTVPEGCIEITAEQYKTIKQGDDYP